MTTKTVTNRSPIISLLIVLYPIIFVLLLQFPAYSIRIGIISPLIFSLLLFLSLAVVRAYLNRTRWKNLVLRLEPFVHELVFSILAFLIVFAFFPFYSELVFIFIIIFLTILVIFACARSSSVSWRHVILGFISGLVLLSLIIFALPYFNPSKSVLIGVAIPISVILPLAILALLNFISRAHAAPVLALLLLIASTAPYLIPQTYTTFWGEKKVQDIAAEIASGRSDNESIVRGIIDWESKNIRNAYGVREEEFLDLHIASEPPYILKRGSNSSEIVFYKYGACRQYAILFAALARAKTINIQTRMVHNPGEDHQWVEVLLDDNWVHVDPSNNIFNDSGVYENKWSKQLSYVYAEYENGDKENITNRYTGTGRLVIHVIKNGENVENAKVTVKSRFLMENVGGMYKEPRNIAPDDTFHTSKDGKCVFYLGGNNYTITAALDGSKGEKTISLKENVETLVTLYIS